MYYQKISNWSVLILKITGVVDESNNSTGLTNNRIPEAHFERYVCWTVWLSGLLQCEGTNTEQYVKDGNAKETIDLITWKGPKIKRPDLWGHFTDHSNPHCFGKRYISSIIVKKSLIFFQTCFPIRKPQCQSTYRNALQGSLWHAKVGLSNIYAQVDTPE